MYFKVGTDGLIYVRKNIACWTRIQHQYEYAGATMLRNGTILAIPSKVGDGGLHVLATPTAPPEILIAGVPAVGVRAVTTLFDGSVVLLDMDGDLWRGLTPRSGYTRVQRGGPPLLDITTLPDGSLLGLGKGGVLGRCATPGADWAELKTVPYPDLTKIEALADGTVLGVDTHGLLVTLAGLDAAWVSVPEGVPVLDVTALAGDTLLGISSDHKLMTADGHPASWFPLDGPKATTVALALLTDGNLVALADNGQLLSAPTAGQKIGDWHPVAGTAVQMISLAARPDGSLLGVGKDHKLYQRSLAADWAEVPAGGQLFSAVTVLNDGVTLLGIDQARASLLILRPGAGWAVYTGAGDIAALSALPDGSILEITQNGLLRKRPTLASPSTVRAGIDPGRQVIHVPDDYDYLPGPARWLLPFTSADPTAVTGDGRPWGDGTRMAARAGQGLPPWDFGNRVTPLIGGFATLCAIRDAFEAAILDAEAQAAQNVPPGQRGHVYIVDWLLNALRDLSEDNPWGGGPWKPGGDFSDPGHQAIRDQTALGLIARMMSAGIRVRVMIWMPTSTQATFAVARQAEEHWSLAAAIEDLNANLVKQGGTWAAADPIGVCALDLRTANVASASLHQKMVVVRVGGVHVGFCGGVDMAFTRRDFRRPADQLIGSGDWQSGDASPQSKMGWPKQDPAPLSGYPATFPVWGGGPFGDELGSDVYGKPRHWHDQHLKLEGPIVTSLEAQFAERWVLPATACTFSRTDKTVGGDNRVIFTSKTAYDMKNIIAALPEPQPCPAVGDALVQMWRTIPLNNQRPRKPPFIRGEFTILAGVANAVTKAKHLITIWDQYFWSEPLVKLLADQIKAQPTLRLLIVLPPHGSNEPENEMWYRQRAMQALWKTLKDNGQDRVLALNAWAVDLNVGVYVHAKVQTYDDSLLVCGSANMNRRSFTCDMELDCAVLHPPTVRCHLAGLAQMVTGRPWTDFGPGWLDKYWTAIQGNHAKTMIPDPFYNDTAITTTPNGVAIKPGGSIPEGSFEPSSLSTAVETATAPAQIPGDPGVAGRLDEIAFLLEKYYSDGGFPYRKS